MIADETENQRLRKKGETTNKKNRRQVLLYHCSTQLKSHRSAQATMIGGPKSNQSTARYSNKTNHIDGLKQYKTSTTFANSA